RMASASRIEAMQAGLRDHHRPVRMASAGRPHDTQHALLHRVRDLHDDQKQMRLVLAPGNVARGIIIRLVEPARIQEADDRHLLRHVVERGGAGAGLEACAHYGARIARQRGYEGGLARTGLAKEPDHRGGRLGTMARTLLADARRTRLAEQTFADGAPQSVKNFHASAPALNTNPETVPWKRSGGIFRDKTPDGRIQPVAIRPHGCCALGRLTWKATFSGNDNALQLFQPPMFQLQVFQMDMITLFGQLPRLAFAVAVVLGGTVAASAQDQPAAPLYAAAQAERGQSAYRQSCQDCHGSSLDNGEFGGPPLKGGYFRTRW